MPPLRGPLKPLSRENHQRKDTPTKPRIAAHLLGRNEIDELPQTLNQAQGDRDHNETRMQSRGPTRAATGANKPRSTPTPQTCPNRRPHTRSVTTEASNPRSVASRIRRSSRDPEPGRSASPMRERQSGGAKQERHRRPSTPAKGTTDVGE
ncbi:hypothetical protein DY000_02057102 [Brassica cretica]|uniref:DET1- and DDB1-associated protein 1 n=1 Tax=Brassica cretica TaxID=69181 RepID=A0ABQ7A8C5_BRACR|nr:hypothetical protein DY000_02057102 [Brassica cretica]